MAYSVSDGLNFGSYQLPFCNCESQAFPLCRYAYATNPVQYSDVSISPMTRLLLQQGQPGIPHRGEFAQCSCFNGWTNVDCREQTCGVPTDANTTHQLSIFFNNCYARGGKCFNGQPRMCVCQPYYSPPASIDPSLPFYAYSAYPCGCPASSTFLESFFRINGVTLNDSTIPNTVCGG